MLPFLMKTRKWRESKRIDRKKVRLFVDLTYRRTANAPHTVESVGPLQI